VTGRQGLKHIYGSGDCLHYNYRLNAAINILRAGCPEVKPAEMKALVQNNLNETIVNETGNIHKTLTVDKGNHYSFL